MGMPPSPAPSGPSAPQGQTGSPREPASPGLLGWAALPPPPGQAGLQHLRAESQLGAGNPDLGGQREVLPPLMLLCGCLYLCRGTPPRPPRPLLALRMPCWLPGTLGVPSSSSHKRTEAKGPKCSLRLLGPSQHHWRGVGGSAVLSGSREGPGSSPGPPSGAPRALPAPSSLRGAGLTSPGCPTQLPTSRLQQAPQSPAAPRPVPRPGPAGPWGSWGGIAVNPASHALHLGVQTLLVLGVWGHSPAQASESQLPPGMSLSAGAVVIGPAWDARASYLGPQEPPILVQSWPEIQPQRWDCHSP